MKTENDESNTRRIFQVRVLGGLSVLLVLGYALLFRGGRLLIFDALIAILTSLILVGIFSLYLPGHIGRQVEDDINVGRNFVGYGIGLVVAFIFGVVTLQMMGVNSLSNMLTTHRIEALVFIPYTILTLLSVGLSFYLGYRSFRLAGVIDPTGSLFEHGGFFIAVGIPCLGVSILLFIMATLGSEPISDILTLVAFILMVVFFVILMFSAFFDVSLQAKRKREAEESS
jgi:hypothetical protein